MKIRVIDEDAAATIKRQNDIIQSQDFSIRTTGASLREEIKKTKLLLDLFKSKNKMKDVLESLVNCPDCKIKVDEYLKKIAIEKCHSCIYIDNCVNFEKSINCNNYMESVV